MIVAKLSTLYIIHFHSLVRGMKWRNQMWPQLWPANPNWSGHQQDVAEFDWRLAWSSYDQLHPNLLQRLTLARGGELQWISPGAITLISLLKRQKSQLVVTQWIIQGALVIFFESWVKQYWLERWINQILAKFKHWIESDRVSKTPTLREGVKQS